MSDSIRAALERLVNAVEVYDATGMDVLGDAIAAARAALAEQQGEGPSDEELTQFLFDNFRGPIEFICDAEEVAHVMTRNHIKFARAVLARWGNQPAPHDDRGVLPMVISDTGASDEPERERIICASISGGADYINNMPRMLILERITSEGSTYQQYIQEPTPPAEGEVAELAAKLRRLAPHNPLGIADPTITRAAELLQQQHPTPVPVSERPWEREGWCDNEGRCWCMSSLDGPPPRWWLVRPEPLSDGWVLPAHALPLPQGEVEK